MPSSSILAGALLVMIAVYAFSAAVAFIRGERVLREVHRRYPAHWAEVGSPTYVSFAIAGAKFWRPVSASNYFSQQRYRVLDDPALVLRAQSIRGWQRVMTWSMVGVALVAGLGLIGRS